MAKKKTGTIILDSAHFKHRLTFLLKVFPETCKKAIEDEVRVFMKWIVEGSPRESIKPPIDTGALRAHVWAKVGEKIIRLDPVVQRKFLKPGLKAKYEKKAKA